MDVGALVFWTILTLLVAVIVWARVKVRRVAAAQPGTTVAQYAERTRAVWACDPSMFTPRPEHWPLAVAAPFSIENRAAWDRLELTKLDGPRRGLADAWSIRSRPELLGQLHALLREGHRVGFADEVTTWSVHDPATIDGHDHDTEELRWRAQQVKNNARGIRSVRFEAWDLVRAAMLIRAGLSLGWLTRDEALDTLFLLSPTLHRTYAGWPDLGRHFFTARWYWFSQDGAPMIDEDNYDAGRMRSLTDPVTGPWSHVPWDVTLPPSRLLLVDALIDEGLVPGVAEPARTQLGELIDRAIHDRTAP